MPDPDTPQPAADFDVVTLGETLATFVRDDAPDHYIVTPAGAESNVASGLAQLGCRARWISRLGRDEVGRLVHDRIAQRGVDVRVTWDDEHPTAVMIKEITPAGSRVRYYRSRSAARGLDLSDAEQAGSARWIHVTGITPALSPTAAATVAAVLERRTAHRGRVSFDVNYRAVLWPDAAAAARVLVPLARAADVVFIGDDEAEALLGHSANADVAAQILVRDGQEVVVKRGGGQATVVTTAAEISEPALKPQIVNLTGAGDAFAAGYLAATCWGWDPAERLRLGHFMAARVVSVRADIAPDLTDQELAGLRESINSNPVSEVKSPV